MTKTRKESLPTTMRHLKAKDKRQTVHALASSHSQTMAQEMSRIRTASEEKVRREEAERLAAFNKRIADRD